MAVDFDALINILIGKIVFQGPEGANCDLIETWVKELYSSTVHPSATVGKEQPRPSGAESPANVDRALCDAVWLWLRARADLRVERRNVSLQGQDDLSIAEAVHGKESAPRTVDPSNGENFLLEADDLADSVAGNSPRQSSPSSPHHCKSPRSRESQSDFLVADEHRIWIAVTGHGVDYKKVPGSAFQLLLIIARSGPAGIAQPRLAELSGQDIRSVPQRTDRLRRDGYIRKSRTLERSVRTSLCTLNSFSTHDEPVSVAAMSSDKLRGYIFRDGALKVHVLLDLLISHLQEWETVSLWDLRASIGVSAKKTERTLANDIIEGMERQKWLEIERHAHKVSASGLHMVNVKLLSRPTADEKIAFCESMGQSRGAIDSLSSSAKQAKSTTFSDGSPASTFETEKTSDGAPTGIWCPEQPLQYILYDLIDAAGPAGIDSPGIVKIMGFHFFRKTLDQIIARLTDLWTISQPSHLRHLAIVRDVSMRGKQHQYLYRTYNGCDQAVKAGSLSWKAVTGSSAKHSSSTCDAWGFSLLSADNFAGGDYRASPSQCTRAVGQPTPARRRPLVTSKKRKARPGETDRPVDEPVSPDMAHSRHGASSRYARVGTTQQWNAFKKSTRMMAEMAANIEVESEKYRQEGASAGGTSRLSKRRRISGSALLPGQTGNGANRYATSDFDQTEAGTVSSNTNRLKRPMPEENFQEGPLKVPRLDLDATKRIDAIHEQYLAMSRPGLYINPPQRLPVKLGRPRLKQMYVVIKSDKLSPRVPPRAASSDHSPLRIENRNATARENDATKSRSDPSMAEDDNGRPLEALEKASLDRDLWNAETDDICEDELPSLEPEDPGQCPDSRSRAYRTPDEMDEDRIEDVSRSERELIRGQPSSIEAGVVATHVPVSLPLSGGQDDDRRPIQPEASNAGASSNVSFPSRQQGYSTRRGVNLTGGSLGLKRSTTLLRLVEEAGGVYPGHREIHLPFAQTWQQSETSSVHVDGKTVRRVVNGLVQDGRLLRHYFAFRAKQGTVVTKSVISLPSILATDARVTEMQKTIEACHPRSHRPGWTDPKGSLATKGYTAHHAIGPSEVADRRSALDSIPTDDETIDHRSPQERTRMPGDRHSQAGIVRVISEKETSIVNDTDVALPGDQLKMHNQDARGMSHDGHRLFAKRSRLHAASNRNRIDAARRTEARGAPPVSLKSCDALEQNQEAQLPSIRSMQMHEAHDGTPRGDCSFTLSDHAIRLSAPSQVMHNPSGTISTFFETPGLVPQDTTRKQVRKLKTGYLSSVSHQLRDGPRSLSSRGRDVGFADLDASTTIKPVQGLNKRSDESVWIDPNDRQVPLKSVKGISLSGPESGSQAQNQAGADELMGTASTNPRFRTPTAEKIPLKVGETDIHKLTSCVCLAQLLAGGISRKVDWSRVQQIYHPQSSETVLRQKWKVIRLARAEEIRHFRYNLQETFLLEYEAGRAPTIKYQHMKSSEWDMLLQWTLERWRDLIVPTSQCKYLKAKSSVQSPAELPAERRYFQQRNPSVKRGDRSNAVQVDITSLMYPARWTAEWLSVPMEREFGVCPLGTLEDGIAQDQQSSVAESYVRANIFTPEGEYDSAAAKRSLSKFSGDSLEEALQALLDNKVIVPKGKGRHVPGRNYKTADRFNMLYARHTLKGYPKPLEDALAYKNSLDNHLSHSGASDTVRRERIPYHLRDGEALLLCNLVASGQIRLLAKTPLTTNDLARPLDASKDAAAGTADLPDRRLSVWGFTTKNYKTMHVEGGNIVYPMDLQPTHRFTASDSDQTGQGRLPTAPTTSQDAEVVRPIPVWYDIHGRRLPELWSQIVGHTGSTLALLPGVNVQHLAAPMGVQAGYFEWEMVIVLEWMEGKGLAKRLGRTKSWREQGWMATEQWWTLTAQIRDGEAGAGEAVERVHGVEAREGTMFYSRPYDLWLR